ncbi:MULTISPECIES: thiamine phosphate synthase [Megasphaera]|uniref:Putative thiamine-phosphate diphosphorylase n=1 Tax=Megasphaera hutchinsoni TaxID=1588748 RepID=A0A134CJP1_9FIRM|nr:MULTISPECIES: thiamine phosphate synthase [Megasphaera]EGS32099.1 putative thiamine-phosphate diphosphorylase [Megasphaera sp. UPII 135-E]KXB92344.1 putative thiamine-phosphate diphosphorylase [Megasphaera hutchinsoni]
MLKILAITNHALVSTNYWDRLEKIVASPIDSIILREKTLSEDDYAEYAQRLLKICNIHDKTCILHNFGKVAVRLHIPRFQCSLSYLESHSSLLYYMTNLGVSVHTVAEAKRAEELGATYIMASHVFPTSCKKDMPPIGVDTVREICQAVSIPVYALGGINLETITQLRDVPITGVALMSSLLTCKNPSTYVEALKSNL